MTRSGVIMHYAALMGALLSCSVHFTDATTGDAPAEESEKGHLAGLYCSQATSSFSPSSSVHALRPADVSVISSMGILPSQRAEASRVVSRVTELLSLFNAQVIAIPLDQTSSQHRSLSEEAERLSLSLSHHQRTDGGWNLVLLFVPADSLCACSPQATADVQAIVQEVEAALQVLQRKFNRTLVHAVVWSAHPLQDKCCQLMRDDSINHRPKKAALLVALQQSLHHVLTHPRWHSDREDFTVLLQSVPLIYEPMSDSEEGSFSALNQVAIQLWANMLQARTGEANAKEGDVFSIPCPSEEKPFLQTWRNSPAKTQENANLPVDSVMGAEITCTDHGPSPTTPTSVHQLRPGDIKVVAALGDSLTAANGAGAKTDNLLLVMREYRGLSWSIGGDANLSTVTTLPNILREFSPTLTGFSEGICSEDSPKAFLNQAVPGAKTDNLVQQVHVIVDKMKNDMRIDFQNDWKVITMFIGGNDICDFCTDTVYFSPRNVVGRIREALDILHKEVPRAIVNLVELLHVIPLRELHRTTSLGCPTWLVKFICPCVVKPPEGSAELQKLNDFNRAYQRAMRELIDSGQYDTHDNFTVVLQPFFREVILPTLEDGRPDRSYFSPDCFHLSQKAHSLMARALWNNMIEPVGNKTFTQDFTTDIDLKCPSETAPFFRTAHNSNYTFPGPPPITNWGSDFACSDTAPSDSVPTSVHKLRPGDIKVMAALGDSLTTGFGAKARSFLELKTEYMGVSWSIGGDKNLETVTTLPNILRKFNSNIMGMSKGRNKKHIGFNMAVTGAKIAGIPAQVRRLVDVMKNSSAVDFERDWKLVTLFIGGNDLCMYCNDRASLSPKNYSHHMMTSLDILYNEVPRLMVNVLEILEIEELRRVKRDSLGCNVLQKYSCQCFLEPSDHSPELAEIKRINREYQTETQNLVYGGRYDGREDFTVVLQPFFQNSILPLNADGKPDVTYFSVDCFHFAERGHADMARALWNNMMEPVGKKQTYNNFINDRNSIKCPTKEHPYIFTKVNSAPSTTPTSTSPTTALPLSPTCMDNVPIWTAVVLAVGCLLISWAVTWTTLSCRKRRNKKRMQGKMEMKGTGF